jgi:hypothetical protein
MWVLKGIALGLGIFLFGTIIYVGNKMRPFEANKATGLSTITGPTWHNVWWWVALALTLAIACWLVRPKTVP